MNETILYVITFILLGLFIILTLELEIPKKIKYFFVRTYYLLFEKKKVLKLELFNTPKLGNIYTDTSGSKIHPLPHYGKIYRVQLVYLGNNLYKINETKS